MHFVKDKLTDRFCFVYHLFANTRRLYNAFNVYCRELAPGTVSLTGDRATGDDSKHCAYISENDSM